MKVILAVGLVFGLLISGISVWDAHAATISILDSGDTGMTADGTIFLGGPNPTALSTTSLLLAGITALGLFWRRPRS